MNKESTEQAAREFFARNEYGEFYRAVAYCGYKHATDGAAEIMSAFAREQVEAERRQIADELERITNGSSCEVNRLIAELRGEGE